MAQIIEVEGVGQVEFPDEMDDTQIAEAIYTNFPELRPEQVEPTPGILETVGDVASEAFDRSMQAQQNILGGVETGGLLEAAGQALTTFPDTLKKLRAGLQISQAIAPPADADPLQLPEVQTGLQRLLTEQVEGPIQPLVQTPGERLESPQVQAMVQEYEDAARAIAAKRPSEPGAALAFDVIQMAQEMAPAITLGAITKQGAAPLTMIAGQVYAGRVGQLAAERPDLPPDEIRFQGLASASIETLTETIPVAVLFKRVGISGIRKLLEFTVAEGLQEGASGFLQGLLEQQTIEPDKTMGEILREAGYETVVGTIGAPIVAAPAIGIQAVQRGVTPEAQLGRAMQEEAAAAGFGPGEFEALAAMDPNLQAVRPGVQAPTEPAPIVPEVSPEPPETPPEAPGEAPAEAIQRPVQPVDTGAPATVTTPQGENIDTQFALVEADSLVTSNRDDGTINPNYPEVLQPRDRTRVASQVQIAQMAQALNPNLLGESATAADGAPIIGPDSVVESGNARTLAIRRAYTQEPDSADIYRGYLLQNAERFGLEPSAVDQMENPVLVRIRRDVPRETFDREEFARQANVPTVAAFSPTETAQADAARLTEGDLALFEPGAEGDVMAAGNQRFLEAFAGKLGTGEIAAFTTAEGRFTKQFADRVQAAVFAKAYQDNALVALQAEEATPTSRNILSGLTQAAGAFARARGIQANLGHLDVVTPLVNAIDIVRQATAQKTTVDELAKQKGLFEQLPTETETLARFLYDNRRSGKKTGEGLRQLGEAIERELQAETSGRLFGEPATLQAILDNVLGEQTPGLVPDVGAPVEKDVVGREAFHAAELAFKGEQRNWTLNQVYREAQQNQDSLVTMATAIEKAVAGVRFKNPGIKHRDTAADKVKRNALPSAGYLTDVVRGGFFAHTPEDAIRIAHHFAGNFPVLNEGIKVTPMGYVDMKLAVKFPNGQVGEVQIWSEAVGAFKEDSQRLYNQARALGAKQKDGSIAVTEERLPEYLSLLEQSQDLFVNAISVEEPHWQKIILPFLDESMQQKVQVAAETSLPKVSKKSALESISALKSTVAGSTPVQPSGLRTQPARPPAAETITAARPSREAKVSALDISGAIPESVADAVATPQIEVEEKPRRATSGGTLYANPIQAINEAWKQAAESAIGWMHDAFGWRFSALGKLPSEDLYLSKRYRTLGKIANVEHIAGEIYKTLGNADSKDITAVYEFLTTRGATANKIKDESTRKKAIAVKRLIGRVGRGLVQRDLLKEEQYEAHRDAYLPRLYLKHLLNESDWKALGAGKRVSDLGYLKKRKDIPKEVREILLGEITNPGFLASRGIGNAMRDMAILDFLEQVANEKDWVWGNSIVAWIDPIKGGEARPVSVFWLKNEADQLRKQAQYYTEEHKAKALDVVAQMDEVVDAAIENLGKVPGDYQQVPDTTRHGRLRGMYVRKEIYNDLFGAGTTFQPQASVAERLLGYGGVATRFTQFWKMSKVALNPPAQVRNMVSNGILLHLSGVSFHRVPDRVVSAISEILTNGKHWRVAKKWGITESTFTAQELLRINQDFVKLKAQMKGRVSMAQIGAWLGKVGNAAGDIYQFSEGVFKTAKIIDEMKKGKSEQEAALQAQKWLYDYSLIPGSVRYLRNAPVGVPFITFYYKTAPRMFEVLLKNPMSFLPYAILPYALAAWIADDADVEPEDVQQLRKALPIWLQERGHSFFLPYKDEHGRWQAVDFSYILPWAMFTEAAKEAAKGEVGNVVQTTGLLGGPVPDLVSAIKTNTDSFFRTEIVKKEDPASKQMADMMLYLWRLGAPTFLTDKGATGHLIAALTNQVDRRGDPKLTVRQAAWRLFGMNIYPIEPEKTRRQNLVRMGWEIRETGNRLSQRLRDPNLSKEEKREIRDTYTEIIRDLKQRMKEYREESHIPPGLKTGQ